MRLDELLFGLSMGIVTIFEVVKPKSRKKIVEGLCRLLHYISESLEPEKKENTEN